MLPVPMIAVAIPISFHLLDTATNASYLPAIPAERANWGHECCPFGAPPPTRQGSGRRSLPGSTRCRRFGSCGRSFTLTLQSRVQPCVRGVSACLPAHASAGTCRDVAAHDRPVCGIDLLRSRPAERGLVHLELHPRLRHDADGLPCLVPTSVTACADPSLRVAGTRAPATPHISRRRSSTPAVASAQVDSSSEEESKP
jgi:hypothetical protein